MTLKELAQEYRQSAELIQKREQEIKEEIKKSELTIETDVELRLKLLREERYSLLKTAAYLDSYYDDMEDSIE